MEGQKWKEKHVLAQAIEEVHIWLEYLDINRNLAAEGSGKGPHHYTFRVNTFLSSNGVTSPIFPLSTNACHIEFGLDVLGNLQAQDMILKLWAVPEKDPKWDLDCPQPEDLSMFQCHSSTVFLPWIKWVGPGI